MVFSQQEPEKSPQSRYSPGNGAGRKTLFSAPGDIIPDSRPVDMLQVINGFLLEKVSKRIEVVAVGLVIGVRRQAACGR